MIKIQSTITLSDNNDYLVVSKTTKKEKTYYYLVNLKDNSKVKFCQEKRKGQEIHLIEIDYNKLPKSVLLELFRNMAAIIKNMDD